MECLFFELHFANDDGSSSDWPSSSSSFSSALSSLGEIRTGASNLCDLMSGALSLTFSTCLLGGSSSLVRTVDAALSELLYLKKQESNYTINEIFYYLKIPKAYAVLTAHLSTCLYQL